MGNAKLRRLIDQETRWRDPDCPKHRHNFNVHAYARVRYKNNWVCYFDVMRCDKCNSFKSIPKQGSASGLVKELDPTLPVIRLYSTHDMRIGFADLHLEKG